MNEAETIAKYGRKEFFKFVWPAKRGYSATQQVIAVLREDDFYDCLLFNKGGDYDKLPKFPVESLFNSWEEYYKKLRNIYI